MNQYYTPETTAKLDRFLDAARLDRKRFWLFDQIGMCDHLPEKTLVKGSVQEAARCGDPLWTISEPDARAALRSLIDAGILQNIDRSSVREITAYLDRDPSAEGPAYGLPPEGTIDFTLQGAELYLRMLREVFQETPDEEEIGALLEVNASHWKIYSTTREGATECFYDDFFRCYSAVRAGDIVEIGPWRERWWRRMPRGWRLDVEIPADAVLL